MQPNGPQQRLSTMSVRRVLLLVGKNHPFDDYYYYYLARYRRSHIVHHTIIPQIISKVIISIHRCFIVASSLPDICNNHNRSNSNRICTSSTTRNNSIIIIPNTSIRIASSIRSYSSSASDVHPSLILPPPPPPPPPRTNESNQHHNISDDSSSSSSYTKNHRNHTASSSSTRTTRTTMTSYDSMMELYDILMSKQIGAYRYPNDYNVYAIQFIRYVVHLNTTSFYGKTSTAAATTTTTTTTTTSMTNDDSDGMAVSHQHPSQQREKEAIIMIINAAFRLWERTAYEYSLLRQQQQQQSHHINTNHSTNNTNNNNNNINNNMDRSLLWLHSTRTFDKLLLKWKMVALSSIRTNAPSSKSNTTSTATATTSTPASTKNSIMSPMEVLQSIQTISNHNRSIPNVNTLFDNHISSYNTILQVLLVQYQRESYYTAPIQLDKFIHQYIIRPAVTATQQQQQQQQQPPVPRQQQPSSTTRYETLSQTAVEFNRNNTDPAYQNKMARSTMTSSSTSSSSTTTTTRTVLKPNIFTYTILLRAWIQSEHPMTLQEIEYILTTIQDIYWYEKNVIPNLHNKDSSDNDDNHYGGTSTKVHKNNTNRSATMDIMTPHMLAIRFYASIGDIKEVETIFEYLQNIDDLPTNDQYGLLLSEMIHSYCMRSFVTESGPLVQLNHLTKAEDLFHVFTNSVINVKFDPTTRKFSPVPMEQYTPDTIKAIMKGANSIMNTYRLLLRPIKKQVILALQKQEEESDGKTGTTNPSVKKNHNNEMIARAEKFLEQIEQYESLDREAFGKLRLPLMDMYSKMHKLPQVQAMFEKYRDGDDNHPHAILIKTYSNCNQPERAEQLVQSMLRNENQRDMVDIEIINLLISTWADCTTCNRTVAADRAHEIYRWIYDHPICIPMKMQPNLETYSYLFDCMARAGSIRSFNGNEDNSPRNRAITRGIASRVETLLNEIENRYLMGGEDTNSCKPDVLLYNCAIKACLNCKEYDQAEYILQLMEQRMSTQPGKSSSDDSQRRDLVIPDIRTYCILLHYYSKLGTVTGAEWTEQLHNHMQSLSQTVNPLLKPTVTTYNIVISAWAASDAPDATDRIWKVYEQMMQVDELELDVSNYTTLLTALCKSKTSNDIQRAIELLQLMQNKAKSSSGSSKVHPDGRHYTMVLRACMDVNDVDNAAYVMNMYIDAYLMQRCRSSDRIDRTMFHWIISTWITRQELVLASWFMFDTVTAVMKAHNIHITSLTNGNPTNIPLVTPAIARVVKMIGIDAAITSQLRIAWTESSNPQHVSEKEKYLIKIKTLITEPIFRSQQQQYHKRFQSPDSESSS